MIFILALGASALIVLPAAGLTWVAVRLYSIRQGRRLDRSGGAR